MKRYLSLILLLALAACGPRTTEQPGPDPRLEAEVDRTREALAAGPLEAPGTALVVALIESGELRWVRSFGQGADGLPIDHGKIFQVPQWAPLLLAVGLERLADQGKPALPEAQRRELLALPEEKLAAALAARLEQEAGRPWRDYLQQEILDPLAMKNTRLPAGEPSLEASAEDLVRLMVDLQKAHAGRTWRRLTQPAAQRLLAPLDAGGHGLGFTLGGQGQATHYFRRGRAGDFSFVLVGFVSSGNGAVIFGPTDAAVESAMKVLAKEFDWPALKG